MPSLTPRPFGLPPYWATLAPETIALIRKVYELFNRQQLEQYVEVFDPDVQFVLTPEATPSPQTLRGHAGVGSFARDIWRTFDDFHISPLKIEELTEEWYLASLVLRGKIRGSPAEFDSPFVHLINIRDGRVRQLRVYKEGASALQDPELTAARRPLRYERRLGVSSYRWRAASRSAVSAFARSTGRLRSVRSCPLLRASLAPKLRGPSRVRPSRV